MRAVEQTEQIKINGLTDEKTKAEAATAATVIKTVVTNRLSQLSLN